jgi:aspartate kinase
MNTVVLKFGGTSVADNIKLNVVAEKVISLKEETENVVVVVSAQGKTTNQLIKEAQELSAIPEEREMDMLLSTGEQITAAKLSILLNRKGYPAISLTGWQAGIQTNSIHTSAKIEQICTNRLEEELKKGNIVIVTGFQGLDEKQDITTLGRGGSDTTAVALQVALKADKCYIFSDVDGIYSADPNMVTIAKRLDEISFDEMQEVADSRS